MIGQTTVNCMAIVAAVCLGLSVPKILLGKISAKEILLTLAAICGVSASASVKGCSKAIHVTPVDVAQYPSPLFVGISLVIFLAIACATFISQAKEKGKKDE